MGFSPGTRKRTCGNTINNIHGILLLLSTIIKLQMDNTMGIQKKKASRSIYYFVGSLVVALALTFFLKEPTFTDSQVYALFILFFAIALWITEAIPPFAVSLFIFAYLVFTFDNLHLNSAPEKIDRYVN